MRIDRVVLIAIAVTASLGCGESTSSSTTRGSTPATSPGSTSGSAMETRPARAERAGQLLFLLPHDVPAGMKIASATSSESAPVSVEGSGVAIGRPRGQEYDEFVRALITSAPADREVSDDERAELREVDIRGHTARLMEHEVIGTIVDWYQEGRSIGVVGPPGAAELVLEVARALDLSKDGADVLTAVPEGFVRLGAFHSRGEPRTSWSVLMSSDDGPFVSIDGSLVSEGFPPVFLLGGGRLVAPVEVRGGVGATAMSPSFGGGTMTSISWLERPDLGITIRGSDRETVLAVAAGLREVDRTEFAAAGPTPSPPPEPSTTSTR